MMACYDERVLQGNLHDGIPAELPAELVSVLKNAAAVRIERILSRGHSSPETFWYDQEENEFVLLVQGRAKLEIAGRGEVELAAGDYIDIPAHVRHRVTYTEPHVDSIWLAVFYRG